MKSKITNLEFFKGKLQTIEKDLIQLEKIYIKTHQNTIETISNLKEMEALPLLTYKKIHLENLKYYLKHIEKKQLEVLQIIQKANEKIYKLNDITLLDMFSQSVESHIVKKLKKHYYLKRKNLKGKSYYFIFQYGNTHYCIFGKFKALFSFSHLNELISYIEKKLKNQIIFPNPDALNFFLDTTKKKKTYPPSRLYIAQFEVETHKQVYIIFENQFKYKTKIENLKLYPYSGNRNIPYFFLDKGKRYYYLCF